MSKPGRIIEGFWNCQYCGAKKIRGGLRECPSCGKARGVGTKFEMDRANPNYVKPEIAKTVSRNPDWLCSFCEQLNNDNDCNCISCGASKEDSEKNYFEMKKYQEEKLAEQKRLEEEQKKLERDSDNSYNEYISSLNLKEDCNEEEREEIYDKLNGTYHDNPLGNFLDFCASNIQTILFSLLGIGLFGLLVWGLVCLFTPKEDTLTVYQMSWERNIDIQEERTVKENDWNVPSGGRVYKTQSEIHHYESVIDHYETVTETKTRQIVTGYEDYVSGYRDLGNGYFEEIISSRPVYGTETYTETRQEPVYRQDPVYQTKYYYEIEKWFSYRDVKTSGNDKEPYWGEVVLQKKEREGHRSENYYILATNLEEEQKQYAINFNEWENIEVGDVLKVKIHLFGQIEILDKNGMNIGAEPR